MSKPVHNPRRAASRWYVVRSGPSLELRAAASLSRAGFGVYVPMRKTERQHRRTKAWSTVAAPLLPGYLFVDVPPVATEYISRSDRPSWFVLRQCDGVASVLGVDDGSGESHPFPVLGRIVEQLMAAQLNMEFDDTREAKIRREEIGRTERETTAMYFPVGSSVRINAGVFADFSGSVTGVTTRGEIEALVMLFGRLTTCTIEAAQVERLAA